MKSTHTIQDIENLMHDYVIKIQNAETKDEKKALLKKLKSLENHYNSCNDKNINGKKYPVKRKPVYTPKEELIALIESVNVENNWSEPFNHLDGIFPPFSKK